LGTGFRKSAIAETGFCCLNVLAHRLTGHAVYDIMVDNIADIVLSKFPNGSPLARYNDINKLSFKEISDIIMKEVSVIDG